MMTNVIIIPLFVNIFLKILILFGFVLSVLLIVVVFRSMSPSSPLDGFVLIRPSARCSLPQNRACPGASVGASQREGEVWPYFRWGNENFDGHAKAAICPPSSYRFGEAVACSRRKKRPRRQFSRPESIDGFLMSQNGIKYLRKKHVF